MFKKPIVKEGSRGILNRGKMRADCRCLLVTDVPICVSSKEDRHVVGIGSNVLGHMLPELEVFVIGSTRVGSSPSDKQAFPS